MSMKHGDENIFFFNKKNNNSDNNNKKKQLGNKSLCEQVRTLVLPCFCIDLHETRHYTQIHFTPCATDLLGTIYFSSVRKFNA